MQIRKNTTPAYETLMDAAPGSLAWEANIIASMQHTRVMVRAMAQTFDEEECLQFAHAFGERLVQSWWEASCVRHKITLELRRPQKAIAPFALSESLISIAESLGSIAARLEPDSAAY